MKLKHYFHRVRSQQSATDGDLMEVTCMSILSKITDALSIPTLDTKMINAQMSLQEVTAILSTTKDKSAKMIPYILQNLGIRDNNPTAYLAYYYLDILTNQMYTDSLINMVCTCYKKGVNFIVDFGMDDFSYKLDSPRIYVEYKSVSGGGHVISTIIYHHPFNGEMDMTDFHSLLLDYMFILNPEKCFMYLTSKFCSNVNTISCGPNSEILLQPLYGGIYSSISENVGVASQYRYDGVVEDVVVNRGRIDPVFTVKEGSLAESNVFGDGYRFDVSQLLSKLYPDGGGW